MTIIIEIDKHYHGFGIDYYVNVKGIRLGYLGIYLLRHSFQDLITAEVDIAIAASRNQPRADQLAVPAAGQSSAETIRKAAAAVRGRKG